MNTNINAHKFAVVSHFLANYEKFDWECNNGELETHINNYKYRLASDREGCYFQAIRDGECIGHSINSMEFQKVEELWNKVWAFVTERNEDTKWKNILIDLLNKTEQTDSL